MSEVLSVYRVTYDLSSTEVRPSLSRVTDLSRLYPNDLIFIENGICSEASPGMGPEFAKPEFLILAAAMIKNVDHFKRQDFLSVLGRLGYLRHAEFFEKLESLEKQRVQIRVENPCFTGDNFTLSFDGYVKLGNLKDSRSAYNIRRSDAMEKFLDAITGHDYVFNSRSYVSAPEVLKAEEVVLDPVYDSADSEINVVLTHVDPGNMVDVKVYNASGHPLPTYATEGSAGFDLKAHLPEEKAIIIEPGKVAIICTGLHVELPVGTQIKVMSRSGLAKKFGIIVLDAPGIIDSDYRGDIMVLLENRGDTAFTVNDGDRIAQGIVMPYLKANWQEVEAHSQLSQTKRGKGGFGSTGL